MKNKAFTIIELLIVISVIGLLSSIILVAVGTAKDKAEVAKSLQFSSSVSHILGIGLIGEWKFENNLNDTSTNGNSGTYKTALAGPAGSPNYEESVHNITKEALSLDGDHYVEVPYLSSFDILAANDVITVELWMKPSTTGILHYLFSNSDQYYLFINATGQLGWTVGSAVSWPDIWPVDCFSAEGLIQSGKWYHIVVTYDGFRPKMFVNAKEECSGEEKAIDMVSTDKPFRIGDSGFTFGHFPFNGLIDELRIYGQGLDISQIKKLYTEGSQRLGLSVEK